MVSSLCKACIEMSLFLSCAAYLTELIHGLVGKHVYDFQPFLTRAEVWFLGFGLHELGAVKLHLGLKCTTFRVNVYCFFNYVYGAVLRLACFKGYGGLDVTLAGYVV